MFSQGYPTEIRDEIKFAIALWNIERFSDYINII